MRHHRIKPLAAVAVAPLAVWLALTGCDSGGSATSAPQSASGSSPDRASPARRGPMTPAERVQGQFEALKRQIAQDSNSISARIKLVEAFLIRARRLVAGETDKVPEIKSAEAIVQDLRKALEIDMKGAYEEVEENVMQILHSPAPDIQAAEGLVDRFPVTLYPDTDIRQRLQALRNTIEKYQKAEMDYYRREGMIKTFGDDYARIIGFLEGFDPDYDDTPYGEKIRELVRENYELYVKTRRERDSVLTSGISRLWPLSDFRWEGHPEFPIGYNKEENALELGPNPETYDRKDEVGSYAMLGDGTWVDVRLTFEARVHDPDNIRFGAKARQDPKTGRDVFLPLSLEKLELPGDDSWHQFVVVVQESTFEITCVSTGKSIKYEHTQSGAPGDFVVQILGTDARVALKRFEYTILEQESRVVELDEDDPDDANGEDDPAGDNTEEESDGERIENDFEIAGEANATP